MSSRMLAALALRAAYWRRNVFYWWRAQRQRAVLGLTFRMPSYDPPTERLFEFETPRDIERWIVRSDRDLGGRSDAALTLWRRERDVDLSRPASLSASPDAPASLSASPDAPASSSPRSSHAPASPPSPSAPAACARFAGTVSTWSPQAGMRTGFTGIVSEPQLAPLDLSFFDAVALRVRGDGRSYVVNLRTTRDVVRGDDVYQCVLRNVPGEWLTLVLPFAHFVPTWRGYVKAHMALNSARIESIGVALLDRREGPFELHLARIDAAQVALAPAALSARGERVLVFDPDDADADADASADAAPGAEAKGGAGAGASSGSAGRGGGGGGGDGARAAAPVPS